MHKWMKIHKIEDMVEGEGLGFRGTISETHGLVDTRTLNN